MSTPRASRALLALLALAAGGALAADPFEALEREAQANVKSAEGARYDAALAAHFNDEALGRAFGRCLQADPPPQAVHGYLDLLGPGAYQVELRPAGRFATCIENAMEGRTGLPEPPRYPYRNPFELRID